MATTTPRGPRTSPNMSGRHRDQQNGSSNLQSPTPAPGSRGDANGNARSVQPGEDYFRPRSRSAPKLPTNADVVQKTKDNLLDQSSKLPTEATFASRPPIDRQNSIIKGTGGADRTLFASEVQRRAFQLIPTSKTPVHTSINNGFGSVWIEMPTRVQKVLQAFFSDEGDTFAENLHQVQNASIEVLLQRPAEGRNFSTFMKELEACRPIRVTWQREGGKSRTIESRYFASAPSRKTSSSQTEGAASSGSKHNFQRRFLQKYSLLNPATALALSLLERGDHKNFARVVASNPERIARELLDQSKISFGPIFSDENIWQTIAYSMPRLLENGGAVTAMLEGLTESFANFLTFHNPTSEKGPYSALTKHIYKGSKFRSDALSNNPESYLSTIERIWERLAPEETLESSILYKQKEEKITDSRLGAALVNIVFSGVRLQLQQAEERKQSQKNKIGIFLDVPQTIIKTAAQADPSKAAPALNDIALRPFTQLLLEGSVTKIANINTQSTPLQMRNYFDSLYSSISKSNVTSGRFVVGQKILSQWEVDALKPSAARAAEVQSDSTTDLISPSSKRQLIVDRLEQNGENVSMSDLSKIRNLRAEQGEEFQLTLGAMSDANPYSLKKG